VNIRALEGSIFIQLQTTIGMIDRRPDLDDPEEEGKKGEEAGCRNPGDDETHSGKQRLQERNAQTTPRATLRMVLPTSCSIC
jgi:hypothetical protein